jgi:hypothetical protein
MYIFDNERERQWERKRKRKERRIHRGRETERKWKEVGNTHKIVIIKIIFN